MRRDRGSSERPVMDLSRQLTLRFPPRRQFRLDDFVAGDNAELVARLGELAQATAFQAVWIAAGAGAGKSHLLQGACHAAAERGRLVAFLPGREVGMQIDACAGLDGFDLVAIDDVDALLGDRGVEEALLALYQALLSGGGQLALAAPRAPRAMTFALPDLASRLRAAQCFQVYPLADDDTREAVRRYAARTGLVLSDEVLAFLLHRDRRSLPAMLAQVDRLDDAAVTAKRRVTVPFVKGVLGL